MKKPTPPYDVSRLAQIRAQLAEHNGTLASLREQRIRLERELKAVQSAEQVALRAIEEIRRTVLDWVEGR